MGLEGNYSLVHKVQGQRFASFQFHSPFFRFHALYPPKTHDAENEPLINTAPRRQGRPTKSQTLAKTIANQEPQLQKQYQPQQQQQQRPQPQRQSQRLINQKLSQNRGEP